MGGHTVINLDVKPIFLRVHLIFSHSLHTELRLSHLYNAMVVSVVFAQTDSDDIRNLLERHLEDFIFPMKVHRVVFFGSHRSRFNVMVMADLKLHKDLVGFLS